MTVLAELVVVRLYPQLQPREVAGLAWSFAELERCVRPAQRLSEPLMQLLSQVWVRHVHGVEWLHPHYVQGMA